MRLLSRGIVNLRRYTTGFYTEDGEWIVGGYDELKLRGNIQPFTNENRQITEEMGVRSEDIIVIYTKQLIRTTNEIAETQADRIFYEGQEWEVQKVKHWKNSYGKLSHYEALAVRMDKDFSDGNP